MFAIKKLLKKPALISKNSKLFQEDNGNVGDQGEDLAESYLVKSGFKIIKRNFRCKGGEIDIIAQKKNELYFVEVKTRTNHSYGAPEGSITIKKRRRITFAAYRYLMLNPQWKDYMKSFSVIIIDLFKQPFHVEFIANAFEVEGDYYS